MAVAWGSTGTGLAYAQNRTNSLIPVPASVATNDVVVVVLYQDAASTLATITAATGFTELTFSPSPVTTGSVSGLTAYWHRATGADSGTYSFAHSSTATEGVAIRYTGCVTTGTPVEVLGSAARSSSSTTAPAVSGTTTQANEMLVYGQGNFGTGSFTPPTGFTERYDGASDLEVADLIQAAAGSTGSLSGTSPSGNGEAILFGLLAAGAAAASPQPPPFNQVARKMASSW